MERIYSVVSDIFGQPCDQIAYQFRDDLDLVNAVELLEQLGSDVQNYHKEKQDRAIEAGIPAFFSSFMPKSGGTYLHNSLLRAGAIDIYNGTQNPINYYQSFLIPSWLKVFLKGGSTCHSHMRPTPYNRKIMKATGVSRIWIHARDPRQAALSSFWHQNGYGQGKGEHAEKRIREENEISSFRAQSERLLGLTPFLEEPFETQIKLQFGAMQQWIWDWLALSDSWQNMRFLFTTYEEMLADRPDFERRVLDFFQYTASDRTVFKNVEGEDRFRSGSIMEWRGVYSADLKKWLSQNIDASVYQRLRWEV
jgi:hypothetical protein